MDEMIYLTPEEVAKKLRVTTGTIYNLIKRGELPAFRVGAQWRIPAEEINDMLKRNANKGVRNHAES